MKTSDETLRQLLVEMACAAQDANHVPSDELDADPMDAWNTLIGELDAVQHFCQKAQQIARHRLRAAHRRQQKLLARSRST